MAKITTKAGRLKDFPLTKRADGRWQKKVRGKVHYFRGTRQEALTEWLRVKDDLLAGHDPRPQTGELTLKSLANRFLEFKQDAVQSGELTQRSWNDYKSACQKVVDILGRTRVVESLNADDFSLLRKSLAEGKSLTTLKNEITRIKVLLKFAEDHDLVERKIRGTAVLRKPSKGDLRKEKERKGGERMFTPEQIRCLIDRASPQMGCMILLAVNCGLGNNDLANLEPHHVQAGWLCYPRPKTGIKRRARLWTETTDAIVAVGLPFVTKQGHKWVSQDTSDNALSKEFRKLLNACDITDKGLTFYSLRRTFRTVADATKDQPACDLAMGHARDDMASVYRQSISDERLEAVSQHVHSWLFGN